jgi:hypothetical protein
MLVLFAQSCYEFSLAPHTIYRTIAAAMSAVGLILVAVVAWRILRARN